MGGVGVGVAGSSENKANLAQLGLELGLSLAKVKTTYKKSTLIGCDIIVN